MKESTGNNSRNSRCTQRNTQMRWIEKNNQLNLQKAIRYT